VVVTHFGREYPMIRFATGDLSAIDPASIDRPSACGRTNLRIRGWLGRADQTAKVRGMFVHPGQVAATARRFPEVIKCRLVLLGRLGEDRMVLRCALAPDAKADDGFASRVAEVLREQTRLRGEIEVVDAAGLPDDGKLIEDARSYD
jgi:phenylacetate-CoA ligase